MDDVEGKRNHRVVIRCDDVLNSGGGWIIAGRHLSQSAVVVVTAVVDAFSVWRKKIIVETEMSRGGIYSNTRERKEKKMSKQVGTDTIGGLESRRQTSPSHAVCPRAHSWLIFS